jgi:serine/threonine-protein kinase RsbT
LKLSQKNIAVSHVSDIASARIAGGELAELAGLNTIQKYCLMTSISELATNILYHAGLGKIVLTIVDGPSNNKGIEVIATDQGKGIEDIELAMQDDYSTNGGLGGGLPGVNRLMNETSVSSTVGKGTVVRAVKWMDESRLTEMAWKSLKTVNK